MRTFKHINPTSIDEAIFWKRRYGSSAVIIAGGTDLLGKLKDQILPVYPEAIINIKTIPGLEFIREGDNNIEIGALTRLHDIATNSIVWEKCKALSMASGRVASPNIRHMGTIGGNICQDIRCWYYRSPQNRFPCLRKGGGRCYAIDGENRYHSIFGGSVDGGCYAVHPSDIAPALIALDAKIKTSSNRIINAEDFFQVAICGTTILNQEEFVTEVQIPISSIDMKSTFHKFSMRKSIDFPIVNCATMIKSSNGIVTDARICLNAVHVKPFRAIKAERMIIGNQFTESSVASAAEEALSGSKPLSHNAFMVQIAKTLVKRSILDCI